MSVSRFRIPIRGLDTESPLGNIIRDHVTGARKVRPLIEYQTRPLEFLTDVLKIPRRTLVWSENPGYSGHSWNGGTVDPLLRVMDVLAGKVPNKRHVAVEAATGTQKTYTAAGLVLWFLGCFEDALVVTTAPKEKQLKEGLWKEIGAHLPQFRKRFRQATSIDLKIRMRPFITDPVSGDEIRQEKWSAVGWCAGVDAGAESAVRSQGFHAEHMLIIAEEMPGMDGSIVTALKNTCTAPHNLLVGLGNPDHALDPLHVFSQLPNVEHVRISALDHPNYVCDDASIVPGATSREFVAEKRTEYGEDGRLYQSRVLGKCPLQAADALIKQHWLEEAARKWDNDEERTRLAQGPLALGVDPAQSPNGDRMALARWKGSVLLDVSKVPARDALGFGEHVWKVMQREGVAPERVAVDSVGVGSNVVNYLRRVLPRDKFIVAIEGGAEDPLPHVQPVAERPAMNPERRYELDANQFLNMRAQVYWNFAQDLMHGRVAMRKDLALWQELVAVRYSTEGGVTRLEKKKDIAKRLGRSPDFADAVVYGAWVRERPLADPVPSKPREWDRSNVHIRDGHLVREEESNDVDRAFALEARLLERQMRRGPAAWHKDPVQPLGRDLLNTLFHHEP